MAIDTWYLYERIVRKRIKKRGGKWFKMKLLKLKKIFKNQKLIIYTWIKIFFFRIQEFILLRQKIKI